MNAFSPKAALALVLVGAALFVALLLAFAAGLATGSANNGGSHAEGRGLNGYAALAGLLERRGYQVSRSRSEGRLDDPGLLVLTPPQGADAARLEEIVSARRYIGPTLVITPKWIAIPVSEEREGAKQGWVELVGTSAPEWPGFLDFVSVNIAPMRAGGKTARWTAAGLEGDLPNAESVLSGSGEGLIPLVVGAQDGRILAAYVDDGIYPALAELALAPATRTRQQQGNEADAGPDEEPLDDPFPLVVVFEPDLIDNYGMADQVNARLADRLIAATMAGDTRTVVFDLTFNGLARSANLLTLAFTPPFLAATLCLLIAALAIGWRAFLRFGPPRRAARAIAFGKQALIANAAGLIRRTRRFHLVSLPYAEQVRERLARSLSLPRGADAETTERLIDRAVAGRMLADNAFSALAARLRAARREKDILRAAQDLHALERTVKR